MIGCEEHKEYRNLCTFCEQWKRIRFDYATKMVRELTIKTIFQPSSLFAYFKNIME